MEMFTVQKQRKIADILMLRSVWFGVQRTDKIGVLNHGEQENFGDGTQDGVVNRQGFWSGGEGKSREFDAR